MDKRQLHHLWTKLRLVRPWYFLAAAAVFAVLAVGGLRQNNLHMIRLREAVYKADEQNGDVETALRKLREYVYAHMNTDLASGTNAIKPPVQLKYRYERLAAGEKARVSAENSKIYSNAQAECERRFPQSFSGSGRIPCIQEYVASHTIQEVPIPDSLYKFDFVSPRWSPDVAGWSLVLAGVCFGAFAIQLGSERLLRAYLRD